MPCASIFGDGRVVRHDEAVEAHPAAQQVGEQPPVARSGHAVDHVEGGHRRPGSGIHGRPIGVEVLVVHAHTAHVHRIVVAAGIGGAVKGEVLDAGHDRIFGRQVIALIAAHHRLGDARTEISILARPLGHAAPAGVAADVRHRREGEGDSPGARLLGGYPGRALDPLQVPRAGEPERDGKDRLVTVDDIHAEEERNAEARLLHGLTLQCVHHLGIYLVDNRADTALRHSRSERVEVGGIELIELPHFFTQSHLREQRVDARLYCGRRNRSNSGSAAP